MKIIDLLNKIANGEEVPKYIKYEDNIYEFDTMMGDYYSYKNKEWFSDEYCGGRSLRGCLNDEVEVLEESQQHKIPEKLDLGDYTEITSKNDMKYKMFEYIFNKNSNAFYNKINEILDYLEKIE